MWDFLLPDFHHYLKPHKQSSLDWIINEKDRKLIVHYSKINDINSSGFRIELFLEPNTTYQLDLEAVLELGEPAFIYVETGRQRLVPRFKIYQGEHGYRLKHNFVTPELESVDSGGYIPVYLGILFHHADQDYRLIVSKLQLTKVAKLTEETLRNLSDENEAQNAKNYEQSFFDQSTMFSQFSNVEKKLEEIEIRLQNLSQPGISGPILNDISNNDRSDSSNFSKVKSHSTKDGGNEDVIIGNKELKPINGSDLTQLVNIKQNENDADVRKVIKLDTSIWLPGSVSSDLIHAMMDKKKDLKARIVASITVIPSRLKTLRKVVESVANQAFPVDEILVIVPERYKRKNQSYLINSHTWYTSRGKGGSSRAGTRGTRGTHGTRGTRGWGKPNIKIIRTPDVGPMTKLYPVFRETNPQDLILTFDDDHLYPEYWSLYLSYLYLTHPDFKGVYGFCGYDENQNPVKSQLCNQPQNVQWLDTTYGVAYPRKWIVDEKLMLKQTGFSKEAFYSDVILIANHLAKTRVGRIVIPQIDPLIFDRVIPRPEKWASDWNSLSRMTPRPIARYATVRRLLKEKNYFHLHHLGETLKKKLHEKIGVNSECFQTWTSGIDNVKKEEKIAPNLDRPQLGKMDVGFSGVAYLEFDPDYFADKKVRYLSYLNNVYQTEIVLLYIRKMKRATLEMPRVDSDVSLPAEYAPWLIDGSETIGEYDIIVVDLAFCGNEIIKLKTSKPVFYIYRYPEIGKPRRLVNYKIDGERIGGRIDGGRIDGGRIDGDSVKMIINSQYFFQKHEVEQNLYLWRVLPELVERRIPMNLDTKVHHICSIVTDPYYVTQVEELILFWSKRGNGLPIHLHLGVTSPYYEKIGKWVNELGIKNISIYSASNIFPVLIKNCSSYISMTSCVDLYAVWAGKQGKSLILMRYGEFAEYPKITSIPFTLGEKRVCPEKLIDHSKCKDDFCYCYGYQTVDSFPIVNNQLLQKILIQNYPHKNQKKDTL